MISKRQSTRMTNARVDPDGSLIIDTIRIKPERWRIDSWASGLNIWRWEGGCWSPRAVPPEICLIFPEEGSVRPRRIVQSFSSSLPQAVRDLVGRFKWRQLALIRLAQGSGYFWELIEKCAGLAWLIADAFADEMISYEKALALAAAKRPYVLERLLGQGRPEMLRFLDKVVFKDQSREELENLKTALVQNSIVKETRHLPTVHVASLGSLLECPSLAGCSVVLRGLETQDNPYFLRRAISLIRDCLEIAKEVGIDDAKSTITKVQAVSDLGKLHNSWVERFLSFSRGKLVEKNQHYPTAKQVLWRENFHTQEPSTASRFRMGPEELGLIEQQAMPRKHPLACSRATFPLPPFPGNQDIQPIMTHEELLQEGLDMEHCVGSYKSRVMRGECFIYRVLSPSRATLEISVRYGPRIVQLKGKKNRSVNSETRSAVTAWFNECVQSLSH